MTRREIMEWATNTVNRIFHGHGHSQTFKGTISTFNNQKVVRLSETWTRGKFGGYMNLFFPDIDQAFNVGDEVEVTIKAN